MNSRELRIVYMGTPEFAVLPLRMLVENGYNVIAVVTVPDKPAGRGLKIHQSAVKEYAMSQSIAVYQPEKLKNPEWIEEFKSLRSDLAIVVAFRMLPEVMWAAPRLGTFNLHASLLPKYRGAAPINWAIINGDAQTGVSTFLLNHEIDCGDLLLQEPIEIAQNDTAGTLHDKMMVIGAKVVLQTVDNIAAGTLTPLTQTGHATPAPKIFKDDCRIDWNVSTQVIYNKIRGLSPYPAAWFDFGASTAKILESRYEIIDHQVSNGTIESDNRRWMRIACSNGFIYIEKLQVAGKKAMTIEDFLRGNKI